MVSPVRLCILAFSLVFTAYLSNAVVSGKSGLFSFKARIVLKPLVSLIGCLVACSARISVDTHTQTDRQTDKPTIACRVRCAPHMRARVNQYACAPLIDGLGHATWSGTVPSRARTLSFQKNCHCIFHALVALKRLVSLLGRLVACSARIVVDRQTHTHRTTTVTLAAHARRGLITTTM